MSNSKAMRSAARSRERKRARAEEIYRKHGPHIPELIRQLAGPTQKDHDRAYRRLSEMGEFIVPELLEALTNPALDPAATGEVVSLLALTGDERAREPVWRFFEANRDNPKRASTAVLSLASMGDERALPHLRAGLESEDEDLIANSAAGMMLMGQLEDIPRLRELHRRHRASREIRGVTASAVLTILEDADQRTFDRTLGEIRTSFVDRDLWSDIWSLLMKRSSQGRRLIH